MHVCFVCTPLSPARRARVRACEGKPPRAPPPLDRQQRSPLARIAAARVPLLENGVRAAYIAAAAVPALLGDGVLAGVAGVLLLLSEVTGAPAGLAAAAAVVLNLGGRALASSVVPDASLLPSLAPTALFAIAAAVAVVYDPDAQPGVGLYAGPDDARAAIEEERREKISQEVRERLGVDELGVEEGRTGEGLKEWDERLPP